MATEMDVRDPARRQLLQIAENAQAERGVMTTEQDVPEVEVPSQFDTPIQATGDIRESILAGVNANFAQNLQQVQENALQTRRFKVGSTSQQELMAAQASRNEAISRLGDAMLTERGQILSALTPIAAQETAGEQARLTQAEGSEQQIRAIQEQGVQARQTQEAQLAESARQFDLSDATQRALFKQNIDETARQFNLSQEQTKELAMASLTENARQANMTDKTQRDLVAIQVAENARQFNLSQKQTAELVREQLAETARQYDLTRTDQVQQFNAEIAERARQFGLSLDQTKELATQQLTESARQFDLSKAENVRQFNENIKETSRQFGISIDTQVRLAGQALAENARQFDLTQEQQLDQFNQNLAETVRQFDLNQEQARDLTIETLVANERIANAQLNVQHLGNMIRLLTDGTEALTPEDGAAIISAVLQMGNVQSTFTGQDMEKAQGTVAILNGGTTPPPGGTTTPGETRGNAQPGQTPLRTITGSDGKPLQVKDGYEAYLRGGFAGLIEWNAQTYGTAEDVTQVINAGGAAAENLIARGGASFANWTPPTGGEPNPDLMKQWLTTRDVWNPDTFDFNSIKDDPDAYASYVALDMDNNGVVDIDDYILYKAAGGTDYGATPPAPAGKPAVQPATETSEQVQTSTQTARIVNGRIIDADPNSPTNGQDLGDATNTWLIQNMQERGWRIL